MSSITTIAGTDVIANSRADINTNFSNLNTDKIETSTLDTDTSLTANSDAKIPTQKAVKAYVDAGGSVNASTTAKGIVEEATQSELDASTTSGGTGARLYLNPGLKIINRKAGIASKDTADASTTQTIAHGLGRTPKGVRYRVRTTMSAATGSVVGDGIWDGSNDYFVGMRDLTGASAPTAWNSSSYSIGLTNGDTLPSATGQTGITSVDSTNITITWTKNGSPTGTLSFMWEAE